MEKKYCEPNCEYFKFSSDVPSCRTSNPGHCEKYDFPVEKNQPCLDLTLSDERKKILLERKQKQNESKY